MSDAPYGLNPSCYRRVLLSAETDDDFVGGSFFTTPPLVKNQNLSLSSNWFWTPVALRNILSGANGATLLVLSELLIS